MDGSTDQTSTRGELSHQSARTLGIIRRPSYGVNDRGGVSLSWTVYITDATAVSHWFEPTEAAAILRAYGVRDVNELDGKPVWVRERGQIIEYDSPAKMGAGHA